MSGGSAQGTVSLTPPVNMVSGTDVTLTIEAEGPGGTDSNYAVLRLSVLSKVISEVSDRLMKHSALVTFQWNRMFGLYKEMKCITGINYR